MERLTTNVPQPDQRLATPVAPLRAQPLTQIRRALGNQAFGQAIQAKLTINRPGDEYEQEADRVADQVMRMPDDSAPAAVRSDGPPHISGLQRKCAQCEEEEIQRQPMNGTMDEEEEESPLQAKEVPGHSPQVTPAVQAQIDGLRGGGEPLPESARAFFEPRFGYDFSHVQTHTGAHAAESAKAVKALAFTAGPNVVFGSGRYEPNTLEGRKLLAHELTHVVQQTPFLSRKTTLIQRFSEDAGSTAPEAQPASESPTAESAPTPASATAERAAETAAAATPSLSLIAEDSAGELAPGQMKKSEFLAELHSSVCRTAEEALARTGRSTEGCPYLDYWFGYYSRQDRSHIERAIHKYAPEASSVTTASEYISLIVARVRRSVELWAMTGEITGAPEGALSATPEAASAAGAKGSGAENGNVLFKGREGGAKDAGNPRALQARLGPGQPLDGGVNSRMSSVFGYNFSRVRMHTDASAADLSGSLNARAFTLGEHVAFGSGEYQPGTLIGDALIAHELAHVVQQGGAGNLVAPMQMGDSRHDALEEDADKSAVGAMVSLFKGAKGALAEITQNAMPRLRSGLRLSRCPGHPPPKTPFQVCARDLQKGLGLVANHAYIEAPPSRYAIITRCKPTSGRDGVIRGTAATKTDISPDPCGKKPSCVDCVPRPGITDLAVCFRDAFNAYADPSLYKAFGPNSNTFAGTLARTCCDNMIPKPKALGNVPGWDDPPAPFRAATCPKGPPKC